MENNAVLWPAIPKYKVVLGDTSNKGKKHYKILREGVAIIGIFAFYCEYNNFYVVTSYKIDIKRQPLETQMFIDTEDNTGTIQVFF